MLPNAARHSVLKLQVPQTLAGDVRTYGWPLFHLGPARDASLELEVISLRLSQAADNVSVSAGEQQQAGGRHRSGSPQAPAWQQGLR